MVERGRTAVESVGIERVRRAGTSWAEAALRWLRWGWHTGHKDVLVVNGQEAGSSGSAVEAVRVEYTVGKSSPAKWRS